MLAGAEGAHRGTVRGVLLAGRLREVPRQPAAAHDGQVHAAELAQEPGWLVVQPYNYLCKANMVMFEYLGLLYDT